MACIARILFLHSKCCRQNARGILASFSRLSTLDFNSFTNSINKGNSIEFIPKRFSSFKDFKHVTLSHERPKIFDKIHLPSSPKVTEPSLLDAFSRIVKIYQKFQKKYFFKKELKAFVSSKDFKVYCELLEKKLPEISPYGLIILYESKNFPDLVSNKLFNKICEQIMNNLHDFELFQKLHIYDKVSKNYSTHEMSNKIKKACEAYFEKYFETDLLHMKFSEELLELLNLNTIPKSMRLIVANKLLEDALRKACSQNNMMALAEKLVLMSPDIRPKHELKELLHLCVFYFTAIPLLMNFSTVYKNLLQQDSFFYSKEILDILYFKSLTKVHTFLSTLNIFLNLCKMGYVSEDMIENTLEYFLHGTVSNVHPSAYCTYVDFFVRSSFQHVCSPQTVNTVIRKLESLKTKEDQIPFPQHCKCCEGLTFLGCDTRSQCSTIFKKVTENYKETTSKHNVLFLHHLAKVCLKDGFEPLSEEILSWLLRAEVASNGALPSENLNDYFGCEGYTLQNCVTSDKHCLHFVSVFGPDNEPIDLSGCNQEKLKDSSQFVEFDKIEKPPGSKVIVFQKFKDKQPIKFYTRPIMSGTARMYLKSFENVDCSIVLLPENFFNLIPQKKKEYLTSEIEQILNISKEKVQKTEKEG